MQALGIGLEILFLKSLTSSAAECNRAPIERQQDVWGEFQKNLDSDLSSAFDKTRALDQMMGPLRSSAFLSVVQSDFHIPLL